MATARGPHRRTIALDDPTGFKALDSRDMLAMTADFPAQCRTGLELGDALDLGDSYRVDYDGIVGLGMGGSAIGSDLLAAIYRAELSVPAATVRDYVLPAWVSERTLVFGVTYSGDTEETLAAFHEARRRGARVIGVTSGGEMARRCREQGVPCVIVPAGQPPRASTGYLLMSLVPVVERLGLIGDQAAARRECLDLLQAQAREYGPQSPTAANRAKQLAELLQGRLPIIYGATPTLGVVAYRWRTQCNENAKTLALSHELPELDHNEVVGWELGRDLLPRRCVIVLTDPALPERMRLRLDITRDLLGADVDVYREPARGESALARVLSAMYLGDFASLYLALLNGVDPFEIKPINELKRRLAEH
ncbi:MAG TPA: bifunctional phosphoglucose/phosphomannose isomerase [Armatimonadota bacterium]|nr:bifunctional phosphoglucose/phosphomannose isomerase [Armatimonadota bacterium]